MEWEKILMILSGVFITLAMGGQLRYEGLHKNPVTVSPPLAIGLFFGIASLLIQGVLIQNAILTVFGTVGTLMSILLIRTSFGIDRKNKRKNES